METHPYVRELIIRLARLESASGWKGDLNPAQRSALSYLGRANKFSRSPSHVADYLGTTRGTTSQSLKALERKGYLFEEQSETDRRSISYSLTERGITVHDEISLLDLSLSTLSSRNRKELGKALQSILHKVVEKNDGRPFGLCKECIHHKKTNQERFCALLSQPLDSDEAEQICSEQVPL